MRRKPAGILRVIAFVLLFAATVCITGAAEAAESDPSKIFTDVSKTAWYYDGVKYAYNAGLMNGKSAKRFGPNENMTRGMFATVLWRREVLPSPHVDNPFTDVKEGKYYKNAAVWAYELGITTGTEEGKYSPGKSLTREQIVTMLYRYTVNELGLKHGKKANLSRYIDGGQVSEYAADAMRWALAYGIVKGYSSIILGPRKTCTRAQIAVMLLRLHELEENRCFLQ